MAIGRGAGRALPTLVVAALIVGSGAGFASFVRTATVNGTATRASVGLLVTKVAIVTGPPDLVLATTHLPAPVVSVWINNTAPHGTVNLSVTVENVGTVPVQNVTSGLTTSTIGFSPVCVLGTQMSAAAPNVPAGGLLDPGASFVTYWTFLAGANLSTCAGHTFFQFTIVFNGQAGT